MNGMPFIGGFTAGEQGTIAGHGCFHGNLSSSLVVFANKDWFFPAKSVFE